MQFVPKDGLYVYFRYDAAQTVMVISNTGTKAISPDWDTLKERTEGFTKMKNTVTGEIISIKSFDIKPNESFVFELIK